MEPEVKKNFYFGVVDRWYYCVGVGDNNNDCSACESIFPNFTMRSHIIVDHQRGEAVQGAWYPIKKGRKGTQDEVHRRNKLI